MTEKRQLEYFLLRYVADAIKDISVPIGIVMHEPGVEDGFVDVRFTHDWRDVQCNDPQADIELLSALEREIREQLVSNEQRVTMLRRFEDSFSNLIRLSPAKGCLAEDPASELKAMVKMYLETAHVGATRQVSGRNKILTTMNNSWEKAGVAGMVQPIRIDAYTKAGDPFTIDFGYRSGGEIKMFHAVSMKASVDTAIMLASRYPKIAPVMSAKTDAALTLTAVIDDDLDRGRDTVQFALSMIEEEKIQIAVAAEMPLIAEQARQDLRA